VAGGWPSNLCHWRSHHTARGHPVYTASWESWKHKIEKRQKIPIWSGVELFGGKVEKRQRRPGRFPFSFFFFLGKSIFVCLYLRILGLESYRADCILWWSKFDLLAQKKFFLNPSVYTFGQVYIYLFFPQRCCGGQVLPSPIPFLEYIPYIRRVEKAFIIPLRLTHVTQSLWSSYCSQ